MTIWRKLTLTTEWQGVLQLLCHLNRMKRMAVCSLKRWKNTTIFHIHSKKNIRQPTDVFYLYRKEELFLPVLHVFPVTVHKFINTSCSINQFSFTGIKWVRSV